MGYAVAIVFLVIFVNFWFWLRRSKGTLKRVKRSIPEAKAAEIRRLEILRRFEAEQEEARKHIELRDKTLALYEQVRRHAAATDVKSTDVVRPAVEEDVTEPGGK